MCRGRRKLEVEPGDDSTEVEFEVDDPLLTCDAGTCRSEAARKPKWTYLGTLVADTAAEVLLVITKVSLPCLERNQGASTVPLE